MNGGATRAWLRAILPPLVTLVVVVGAWEAYVRIAHVKEFNLPAPSLIATSGMSQSKLLLDATAHTALAALVGFLISAFVGVVIAVALNASRWIERAVYPFTIFLQTVPLVAVAPLLILWFGAGFRSVVFCAVIVSLFPVIANTFVGLRSVDPALIDLFRLYGASRLATLMRLKLPAALPNIFTGLRIAAGLAVIGTIVAELVAGTFSDAGLGIEIQSFSRNLRVDLVFASVILASLLGLAMFGAVNLVSYLLLRRWHASEKSSG